MYDFNQAPSYSLPTTTANSAAEGRLKVDAGKKTKKVIIKKHLKKKHGKK